MSEFDISRGTVSWFASSAPLTVAIFAAPLGIYLTRFSLKKTFVIGAFLQGAGILAPFCINYPSLLLTRALFALGTTLTVPVATAIAAEWFTSREMPLVNGFAMSFNNLGNALAYLATVPIATFISWKAPMVAYGAFAVTCATAWLIFGRDRKTGGIAREGIQPQDRVKIPQISIKQVLSQRSTILLALATMGSWSLSNAIGSWLPTYYHEVFKMPLEGASSITAIITGAGVFASVFGGMLSMRLGVRRPFLIIPGIFMGLAAMSSLLFNNLVSICFSVAFFGIFSNVKNAILYTIPMELPNTSKVTGSVIISVFLAAGNFGNFMGPLIVGYLTDTTGSYLPGFIICSVFSLALVVAGLMLPETGPRARKAAVQATV
jgi:MFS transporter, NNP family, nitrate/nitrite transporter